jgi:sodium-dependent dicarboxylate transporter 2/3/5
VAIAMTVFVVLCFLTECIPLPGVAFCIGLILVFTGVVSRKEVAMLYWSDACWFIMGSLMFAAAFVKTGRGQAGVPDDVPQAGVPNVRWITLIFFVIIAPLAAFISDHALAAMFLPIGMLLYQNSLTREVPEDPELGKMLMIAIAMACNIGGPGAPSGGARNVIMMTYLNDMFGLDIGYFQWITYCFPFVIIMIPATWIIGQLALQARSPPWHRPWTTCRPKSTAWAAGTASRSWALIIFVIMVFGWFTEKSFSTWASTRSVWASASSPWPVRWPTCSSPAWSTGAITRKKWTGAWSGSTPAPSFSAAPWTAPARPTGWPAAAIDALAPWAWTPACRLMATSNGLTAILTNLMADGPAAAAVGPIALNMAGLVHPGTTLQRFGAKQPDDQKSLANRPAVVFDTETQCGRQD